jgi:hypothetical protein
MENGARLKESTVNDYLPKASATRRTQRVFANGYADPLVERFPQRIYLHFQSI